MPRSLRSLRKRRVTLKVRLLATMRTNLYPRLPPRLMPPLPLRTTRMRRPTKMMRSKQIMAGLTNKSVDSYLGRAGADHP